MRKNMFLSLFCDVFLLLCQIFSFGFIFWWCGWTASMLFSRFNLKKLWKSLPEVPSVNFGLVVFESWFGFCFVWCSRNFWFDSFLWKYYAGESLDRIYWQFSFEHSSVTSIYTMTQLNCLDFDFVSVYFSFRFGYSRFY